MFVKTWVPLVNCAPRCFNRIDQLQRKNCDIPVTTTKGYKQILFLLHDLHGKIKSKEPVSKRFGLFKVKEGENFNHSNTFSISRIKI